MTIKIDKQLNGKYKVRVWSTPNVFGERKSLQRSGFFGYSVANRWGKETEYKLNDNIIIDDNISFKKLDEKYFEERKTKISPTTLKSTYGTVRNQILQYMKNIKARDISTSIVQKYIDILQSNGAKKKTAKNHTAYIKAVINWGVAHDYFEYNRIKRINYKPDENIFEAKTISIEEAGKILADFKINCYNLYLPTLLSLLTGGRRGEVLGLTWENVDFENKTISYRNNMVSNGTTMEKSIMKTEKSRRTIPMCDYLAEEILEHKEKYAYMEDKHICSNIFNGIILPDYITSHLHYYLNNKFGIKMREHDLRHSFSQFFEDNEALLNAKSELMGHSDTFITQHTYTRQNFEKKRQYLNILGEALRECVQKCVQS